MGGTVSNFRIITIFVRSRYLGEVFGTRRKKIQICSYAPRQDPDWPPYSPIRTGGPGRDLRYFRRAKETRQRRKPPCAFVPRYTFLHRRSIILLQYGCSRLYICSCYMFHYSHPCCPRCVASFMLYLSSVPIHCY